MAPRYFASVVVAIVIAAAGAPADVSGVWSLRLSADGESAPKAQVTFKQDGQKLTGSCLIAETDGESFTLTGQVSENKVTWRCASKGRTVTPSFEATVNATGREMAGTWTTGAAKGTFKGSKPGP
jgi:hypothetical protein